MIFFTWPCSGECHSVIWPELLVVGRSSPIISLCMAYGHRRIDGNRLTAQSCSTHSHRGRGYPPFNITLVLYFCIQQIIHVIVIITHYYIYNIIVNFFYNKILIIFLKLMPLSHFLIFLSTTRPRGLVYLILRIGWT